jgi:hypothetical protein
MKTRSLIALAAACTLVVGCEGLKEAFSAPVDVVARAGGQELSVTRLGNLLGHATQNIPPTRDVADVVAEYWVDYQLLAAAAVKGDSLNDKKAIDAAAQSYTTRMVLAHLQTRVDSMLVSDAPTEGGYNQGLDGVYDARHILFMFPQNATPAQKDSVRKKAASVLPQVTDKNFADMARKYSADGSAQQGGDLGVFNGAQMVPEFTNGVAALKPGQISPLVQSQYGYHIIQRLTYAQAKDKYDAQFKQVAGSGAERAYMAKLDSEANIQVKPTAPAAAKAAAIDEANHRKDNAVLATFKGGELTVARFLMWLDQFPANQRIPVQMQQAPDSLINQFLKSITTNELLMKKADSLHVTLTPEEQDGVYKDFAQVVNLSWNALGVDPKLLADSAKSQPEKAKLAAARVESIMDDMMNGKMQPVPIPTPLKVLLESKYDWKINATGLDRATELARQIRTSADSARAANQPKSQVPLPGGATPPAAPGGTKKP